MLIELPTIQGIIKRRILANYRADADLVRKKLPPEFEPKLHNGHAVVGICLIRLEHIRPKHTPSFVGVSSENAAHRFAVMWTDENGERKEGVYIPRRDTDSTLNHIAGGRVFPGEHHLSRFDVKDDGNAVELSVSSSDGDLNIEVEGAAGSVLPGTSIFDSVDEASKFFEGGSLGYSVSNDPSRLDGIFLETKHWHVEPFTVSRISSSFYDDRSTFPEGTIEFDHALIMREIEHEWHGHSSKSIGCPSD